MIPDNKPPSLDANAQQLIRAKIRYFVAKAPFLREHREDLEQILALAVYRGTAKIGHRSEQRLAYLATLIDNRLIDVLRRVHAGKRDYRRVRSLQALLEEEDGIFVEMGRTLSEQTHDLRLSRQTRSEQDAAGLCRDMADVLRRLPPLLRELAEALQSKSLSEIARDLDVPRSTLQGRVRKLRQIFERTHLQDYLDPSRQSGRRQRW